ncbi:DUF4625 domain-containing protein [Pontibacter sp. BT310]|jgi:uncharacterized membrane protein|uniref:DUF4625 domain-containing protein n=1 Tax=Pontibacter populi TaxID=890055 RepID=A0ABS6XDQ3_9BACT|nr:MULTISPECIES: DUF4625 domain-containing protein [Pontibacter]MBJ6119252.1 DUF4625 domain-containing protein [Pontibacter sp. BT310]MBR0571680.1 DUF4625 domain-containing protein [Microvirga sp. STS03]MBW3366106.1 DUF4625 domain-containing protein [Pontibacter populi]
MKKLNWAFLILFSFAFVACDDDDDEVTLDTTDPVITITSPTEGAAVTAGGVINLEGTVTDNEGLEEITISITDPSGTNTELTDMTIRDFLNDDRNADFDLDINVDANAAPGDWTVIVTALDDAGNEASESVMVTLSE